MKIGFEAYGKDIADSVKVNDRICEEILNYPHPYHVRYEMFLDEGGKKISKSFGNVFTPQVWLKYGTPQSLLLLMYKRIVGSRVVKPEDIPAYMDELDNLEKIYFGKKKIKDVKEESKLKGLYEYSWLLKQPNKIGIHVPYALLANIASFAPEENQHDYILARLRKYDYLKNSPTNELIKKINCAINWSADFAKIQLKPIELSSSECTAIKDLIDTISNEKDENSLQNLIFNTAKKYEIKSGRFFQILYLLLIGSKSGPRLGTYIYDLGIEKTAQILRKEIETHC